MPQRLTLPRLLLLLLCTASSAFKIVRVRYGYFPEARPVHTACARGWLDLINEDTLYQVTCYPQTSGGFVASKLDSQQLDIGILGSTPLAQALARGVDIKVVYINEYKGDSQGIYVRPDEPNYKGIETPFDLKNRTIGVPFGSTMHYQLLFLLDLFGLRGQVRLRNLSPDEIIAYWDKRELDGAGCWGIAKEHLLHTANGKEYPVPPANTLMSAGVLADWGRPTFNVVAVTRTFANQHQEFMAHFVGVLSRLNDSFLDRLGAKDPSNTARWDANKQAGISYLPSLADALMKAGEVPRNPSQTFLNAQRRNLDDFIQQSVPEQVSCHYLGPEPSRCLSPTLQHLAIQQTAEFLLSQKLIGRLGPLQDMGEDSNCNDLDTFCGGDILDGSDLSQAHRECPSCVKVGRYATYVGNELDGPDQLLLKYEELDTASGRSPFAQYEIGRASEGETSTGDSTCTNHTVFSWLGSGLTGMFGDGANAEEGRSYSENLNCAWEIRAQGCSSPGDTCDGIVEIQFQRLRVWSGDYVRVYTDPHHYECQPDSENRPNYELLAQLSQVHESGSVLPIPPIRAKGCIMVVFETDSNQERSYGDIDNIGDGFLASFDRDNIFCSDETCHGLPCNRNQGLCECDGLSWGGDCSATDSCLGTNRLVLDGGETQQLASRADLDFNGYANYNDSVLSPSLAYSNDLDCTWEILATNGEKFVEVQIYHDIEPSFDFIWLRSGSVSSGEDSGVYVVLTGVHTFIGEEGKPDVYLVPTDSFGMVSLQFTTDSRGRRRGFVANVRAVSGPYVEQLCDVPGESGYNCEVHHCVANNRLAAPVRHADAGSYALGRVVSQVEGLWVPAMPWAPDGGCVWPLLPHGSPNVVENIVALRLVFNESAPLDLEPHPHAAIGDKLVIRTGQQKDYDFFIEKCNSDEVCSFEWQTGKCGERGSCEVKTTFEIDNLDIDKITGATARLVTDRNDGGVLYHGLDFEALLVVECPSEDGKAHCEAGGGTCKDGFCYCEGGVPCTCPCDDDANVLSTGVKLAIVIGIVVPVFVIFILGFLWYRRRKIRHSRAQKAIIEAKEAELEAFRNSVVGMRTVEQEYIPRVAGVEKPLPSGKMVLPSLSQEAQWCWKETGHMMSQHSSEDIFGDPSDCWIKYDANSNAFLEAAFQEQGGKGHFSPLQGYSVDFGNMIQTKTSSGFQRDIRRVAERVPSTRHKDVDLSAAVAHSLPEDLIGEPQMVLVTGDVLQVSSERQDGWAFGTKLHHADEAFSRQLLSVATDGMDADEANMFTDTGWFPLEVTRVPTGEDLKVLQTSVGDTGALEPPSYWDPVVDPTVVQHHELLRGNSERDAVVDAFLSSFDKNFQKKAKILKVERIQNLAMWQTYVVKRQTICYRETDQQIGSDTASADAVQRRALERFERRWLWHGTNYQVMDKILQQGFNRSFCGKNATMFGKGVYFARDATYSANKGYAVPDSAGRQYILACRVVVGEYCAGTMNALTPDVRDASNNILYDSTVGLLTQDTMSNPSIYVTYHDAQAYPEYLITFKSSGT